MDGVGGCYMCCCMCCYSIHRRLYQHTCANSIHRPLRLDVFGGTSEWRRLQGFWSFERTVTTMVRLLSLLIQAAQTAKRPPGSQSSMRRQATRKPPLRGQTHTVNLSRKRFRSRFLLRVSILFERLSTRLLRFDMARASSDDIMRGLGPGRASPPSHDARLLCDGCAPELPMQSKSCATEPRAHPDA